VLANRPRLIFYAHASDVAGLPFPHLMGETAQIANLIDQFNAGEIAVLLVPKPLIIGWRTTLTEVVIEFKGKFTEAERAQAYGRLTRPTPSPHTHKVHQSRSQS